MQRETDDKPFGDKAFGEALIVSIARHQEAFFPLGGVAYVYE